MASKNATQERLIAKRGYYLAIMYLTRRDDLVVEDANEGDNLDLLVRCHRAKKKGIREFGVKLHGSWESISKNEANELLRPLMQKMKRQGPFPFPVCLFFFTMEKTQAWYTWIAEPMITPDDKAELVLHDDSSCAPLNDDSLDAIVARVNQWFDVFYGNLIGNV